MATPQQGLLLNAQYAAYIYMCSLTGPAIVTPLFGVVPRYLQYLFLFLGAE